jgi:uncharacterized protein DUF1761
MRAMGYDTNDKAKTQEMKKSAGPACAGSFVVSVVAAFILAKVIGLRPLDGALYGIKIGLGVWLGFVATVQLTGALFIKKA